MSFADPTTHDIVSAAATANIQRSPKAVARTAAARDREARDTNPRSEKPQPKPEDLRTDRPRSPEADPAQEQGPTGITGAFRTHPVAMIVCLGLIVAGIIASVGWYLH